jgi:hypothetical protein
MLIMQRIKASCSIRHTARRRWIVALTALAAAARV